MPSFVPRHNSATNSSLIVDIRQVPIAGDAVAVVRVLKELVRSGFYERDRSEDRREDVSPVPAVEIALPVIRPRSLEVHGLFRLVLGPPQEVRGEVRADEEPETAGLAPSGSVHGIVTRMHRPWPQLHRG